MKNTIRGRNKNSNSTYESKASVSLKYTYLKNVVLNKYIHVMFDQN